MDQHQQRARLLSDDAIKQELKRLEREKKDAQKYKKSLIDELRFRKQHTHPEGE
ncbi:hypothetical protein [Lysobacter brunescens]|uniref:Uncharacterized protein n=1 Tax=Lysobacter brunescens TaxID=262323 RepID=A0ABW2YGX0_9GAMM